MSTTTDVFSNPSNDYVYPGLAPCTNVSDDQYLKWTDEGLSIIKGTEEISTILFNDLKIPISAYNKQQIILNSGEVTFIQGLTKGLCNRTQGFSFPSLTSTDQDLNQYFMQIDLSVNYYKNFTYTYTNVEASANYVGNLSVADSLNFVFDSNDINILSTYDPSVMSFEGTAAGYDFSISNVVLNIVDTSTNTSSPFGHAINSSTFELVEDTSSAIAACKYPNTGMQGIILKALYPTEFDDEEIYDVDDWIYLNHVSDYITSYTPITIDSSTYYEKWIKGLDIGMSGLSTDEIMSAGDYLNWVTVNDYWKKVGDMYIWSSAEDSTDCTVKNLIEGFYVFNPHTFPVQIEYMVFT